MTDLGRYDEAGAAYEQAIQVELGDARSVAVAKGQLAGVRIRQKRYVEALDLYAEVRKTFQELGEPGYVGVAWHQIGMVHENAGQYEAAEEAYQES